MLSRLRLGDFPGGPVVKNPPSNAGDAGSIPGWETRLSQAAGQLSPWATTTEPVRLSEREAQAPQLERNPSGDPTCLNKDPMCCNYNPTQPKKKENK